MAIVELKPLKPTEALEFFRAKGFAPPDARFDYRDVWQDQHARMFVVAKAMRDDVLTLLRQAVDQALDQGRTLAQFTADLEPELQRLGWWGEGTERDPLTGELKTVQLGSKRRLATIFDANMRAARAAGRWAQIQRTKVAFPYLWYRQVQRESRRKEHRRYHDIILPVDHPAWLQIYPPNGWFCACTVRQLSEAQMRRRGLKVTENFELIDRPVLNKRTGQIEDVPLGIDPAWVGNPGAAAADLARRHDLVIEDEQIAPPTEAVPAAALAQSELALARRNRAIERALIDEARTRGLRNGHEHLVLYDAETGAETDWTTSRQPDSVTPTALMDRVMHTPSRRVVAIHNHPQSTSFSDADLRYLGRAPGLQTLVIAAHDGSIYRARAIDGSRLAALAEAARRPAQQAILELLPLNEFTDRELGSLVSHVAISALARLGLVRYRSVFTGATLALSRRVGDRLEQVITRAAAKLRAMQ